ncbi:metal-dependent hydrolase family protein [Saccharomonospora glauca]|jgi:imidazolonepropionase-like amidohydrolase|uniref:Amidohydrolase, imidazolonepropionase n=1 Tax=Saccharomonospora glauca K62 TaxID=928724 RepID=I1D233_9PSEU|nr:amidohydrolase family protein [Saccharomonospora glauca]EIE99007.1 amidohydrolase, imidazolonepropionase [Saccharomonospora glauca K62]
MPGEQRSSILIRNARIFDGVNDEVRTGHVRVEGRKIVHVGSGEPASTDADVVIDAGGRTLIPGLSDAHAHVMLIGATSTALLAGGTGLSYLTAAAEARAMLLRGFTTIRDMAGDTADLKRLIDAGVLPGPRIYPSQAGISQTAGHGDFGMVYDRPTVLGGTQARAEELGAMRVANGRAQVLAAVREQLKRGASQIKLMAGGGVASAYDPLDVLQFTADEMRAAVEAATDWGTYVCVHVYTGRGIRRAVDAGVAVIEHGQLAGEDDIKYMADHGVWLSTQPFVEDDHSYPDPESAEKNRRVCAGVRRTFEWALKHGVKVAFGTDLMLAPNKSGRQSEMLTRLATLCGSSMEGLKIATSGNAELFRLSGPRDPYQIPTGTEGAEAPHHNHLGVIAEGAWADMLLVEGDPTRDLGLLGDPDTNLRVIIKDGHIHKNTLAT